MKKNIKLYVSLAFIVLFVALMIVATFCDLQISNAVVILPNRKYISENVFGRIFETIGETPIYFLCIFAGDIIFLNFLKRKKSAFNTFIMVCGIAVMVIMSFLLIKAVIGYLGDHFGFAYKISGFSYTLGYFAFALVFSFAVVYFTFKLDNEFLNKMLIWALIVIFTAIISQLFSKGLKLFAGRCRYRTMNVLDNYSYYTKWFEFKGKRVPSEMMIRMGVAEDGFKSFPSGHTSGATMVITLTYLPLLFKGLNNKLAKILIWGLGGLFVFLVAFSRILVGAHYLSDVVFGCFLTVLSYYASICVADYILVDMLKLSPLPTIDNVGVVEQVEN